MFCQLPLVDLSFPASLKRLYTYTSIMFTTFKENIYVIFLTAAIMEIQRLTLSYNRQNVKLLLMKLSQVFFFFLIQLKKNSTAFSTRLCIITDEESSITFYG